MAFQGYILKVEGVQFPNVYVNGYAVSPLKRTDKNSYIDGDGKLNRTILPHKRSAITFSTGPITDDDMSCLTSIFNKRDKVNVTYWDPTSQSYKDGVFYVVDFEVKSLVIISGKMYYRPIEFEFIEY